MRPVKPRRYGGYPHKGLYGLTRRAVRAVATKLLSVLGTRGVYFATGPDHPANRIDLAPFELGLWSEIRDYVRYATVELIARELERNNVPGALAELGVFQGHFSAAMSKRLPDRDIYLFDTFTGFDERDVRSESQRGSATAGAFGTTSLDFVLEGMPWPERVRPVVGWFPESAESLNPDLRFAMVSLDADLYDPISSGLSWFYPKLSRGGFILVHDMNNDAYPGARQALVEFCRREGVAFVPLPDSGGSAVISKGL